MATINNVSVLGAGVLGSQIIMQAAYHGKKVTAHDISDEVLAGLPGRWKWMRERYRRDLPDFEETRFDEAISSIQLTTDPARAVADADLVIESVPENLDLKREVWTRVGESAPSEAIFTTNSSALRPSDFAEATGRPDRFLALHFANLVWSNNTGEVMRTPATSQHAFDAVLEFAAEIGLEPIALAKETPGYVVNSLLIPWLNAAAYLYVDGAASVSDIDKTWRIATGAPLGPFQVYDIVGFKVVANVIRNTPDDEKLQHFGDLLVERGIEQGRTGIADGIGFYVYDSEGMIVSVAENWSAAENLPDVENPPTEVNAPTDVNPPIDE